MIDLSRYRTYGSFPSTYLADFARVCDVTDAPPEITSYPDAIYTPAQRRPQGSLYYGVVLDRDGNSVKHGALSRYGKVITQPGVCEPTSKGGSALYLGWIFPRYGHVLLETLSRTWAVDQASYDAVLFHNIKLEPLRAYLRELLTSVGVDLSLLAIPSQATRFDVIHVPEPASEIGHSAHRAAVQIYDRIPGAPNPDSRPAYISRSRLAWGKRSVIGEDVLEAILEEEGFRIIHPQEMSITEQATAFRSHQTYVGMIGSAMHSILFARQKPRVIYLGADTPAHTYMLCDELVDAKGVYVNCCRSIAGRRFGAFQLDLAAALSALQQEGLVRPRDVTDAQKSIDREFEVWSAAAEESSDKKSSNFVTPRGARATRVRR